MEEPWLLPQTLTTLHVPLAVKCVNYHDSIPPSFVVGPITEL